MKIVLTGGGSGGHIYPLVAVAQELRAQVGDVELLYIGTRSQMHVLADEAMAKNDIPVKNILTGKMRRYFSWQYFVDFIRIPCGIIQSLFILLWHMPDAVFSKGGYAAVPVVIAAWIYRIPVLTHESDVVPGWANRVCGKLSRNVAIAFPEARQYFHKEKTVLTGNPIRSTMRQGDANRARSTWGIEAGMPVILVSGGSQGARAINDSIVRILPQLTQQAHIIHATGSGEYDRVREQVALYEEKISAKRYTVKPFLDATDMADAYAVADMMIGRPGSGTIAEIAANQLPSILIPHASSANDHQRMNAFAAGKAGAALVLDEDNIGEHILHEKIATILASADMREKFAKNITVFDFPDAPEKIVAGILQMMR